MIDDDLVRAIAELSRQFASRLPAQLADLSRQASALRLSPEAAIDPLRQQLVHTLHKLAGGAGSFGFETLGEHARRLELLLSEDASFLPAQQDALRQALDEITTLSRHVRNDDTLDAPPAAATEQHAASILVHEPASAQPGLIPALATMGYVATRCEDPQELLAASRRADHILILDLSGQSRAAVLALLATLAGPARQATLLLVSDHGDFDVRLQAIRSGVVGLFSAPLRLTELESRLERLLTRHLDAPYRIMIIDDDVELARHYQLVLQQSGMDVIIAHQAMEAMPALYQFQPEVLLLDVNMPGCSGPELARIIRLDESLLQLPISYLSAETDVSRQRQALLHAGDDFLTKPVQDAALVSAVRARAQRARLLAQAMACDSLTGLLRHNDIKARITHELAHRQRQHTAVTVAMIDIDHFKRVNDNHGHQCGDQVIRALANLLRQRLRKTDGLGRYGGEEYAAVLVECPAEQALALLDHIRQAFSELVFESQAGRFSTTFSAGVAEATDTDTLSGLLERADRALYAAKQQGRNRIMTG